MKLRNADSDPHPHIPDTFASLVGTVVLNARLSLIVRTLLRQARAQGLDLFRLLSVLDALTPSGVSPKTRLTPRSSKPRAK